MGHYLVDKIYGNARAVPGREAYRFCWQKDGEWISTAWSDFAIQVDNAANALAALHLEEKDTIAICSPNTPQIFTTELGAFCNRLAAIPIYSSSSQAQFDFIVDNGGASVIFIGDRNQYDLAYNHFKANPGKIKIVVVFNFNGLDLYDDDTVTVSWDTFLLMGMKAQQRMAEKVRDRMSRALPEDPATLIYTSGTTGEPKGVVITHANYEATIDKHIEFLQQIRDEDLSMAFLPLSHILEKAWSFFCLVRRIPIAVNGDPRLIQDTIQEVKPTIMCCVPRFWEKIYAGIKEKIAGMGFVQRNMVKRAIACGRRRNLDYKRLGKRVPALLEKEYRFWDKRVFQVMKKTIGIPRANFFPTAGAPLSNRICEFMHSIGIDVIIGYGLSETTATVTVFPPVGYEIGTVGVPLPGIEVKIDPENSEILVKADSVTPGYFNNPEANAAAFTADGFFRTGDAGHFTPSGALVLTERVKDLFKTSNGKYIAPQMMESRLAENKYIDEVAVIGDQRKYVTALVVPNLSQLRKWAEQNGVDASDPKALCANPRTVAFMQSEIDALQRDIAEYEKIKRITLLPNHFSIMMGEVTNTMKVRRPVVAKRYAAEIEKMYQ